MRKKFYFLFVFCLILCACTKTTAKHKEIEIPTVSQYNDMLPIGSVVLLKGGEKRIMIIGRVQTKLGDDTIYDYSAIYYPQGMIDNESIFFFNEDAIEKVYFKGYEDAEEIEFRENVLDKLGKLEVKDGQIISVE